MDYRTTTEKIIERTFLILISLSFGGLLILAAAMTARLYH